MTKRVRFLATLVASIASLPASAEAGPAWLDPVTLSPEGGDVFDAYSDVGMDPDGDVLAVWARGNGIEAAFRPAGGSFGAIETVPQVADGTGATTPVVAFDGRTAVIAFTQFRGSGFVVARAVRYPDGSYGETTQLSTPGVLANVPRIAGNAAGDMVTMWEEYDNVDHTFATRFRPAGAEFEAAATFPSSGDQGYAGAVDPAGNTLVVWDAGTVLQSTSRPQGGAFGAATPIVSAADDLAAPAVALAPGGAALLAYLHYDPTATGPTASFPHLRAWATARAAGAGSFGAPQDISANDLGTVFTGAAIDGHGDAVALYQAGSQPWAAVAPPGGSFSDAARLSPAAHDMYDPQIEVAGDGTTHIVWEGNGDDGAHARHVIRPAGGPFTAMQTLPGGPSNGSYASLATDAHGDAVALWRKAVGADDRIHASGYDAAGPQLRGLTIPAAGTIGTPLAFSVAPVDVWSPVAGTVWDFGDGATAGGAQASHAYAAPGAFTARVTATDTLGNAASAAGPVAATTPPPSPGTLALGPLSLSPRAFRAARRGPSLAATRTGTRARFRLGRDATVRFGAERRTTGRRVGGRCVKTTKRNRARSRCARYAPVKGSASRAAKAGANSVRFTGRLGGRRLRPGRYRLVARATDAGGVRSAVRRAAFRVVR